MKWVKYIAFGALALILLVLIVGLFLPSQWVVQREITIAAKPESIHAHVGHLDRWPEWMPCYTEDPAMQITYEGPSGSVGSILRWKSAKMGDGSLELTKSDPRTGITYELAMDELDEPTHGSITLEPRGDTTRVVWHDTGKVGRNPLMRLLVPIVLEPMLGRYFARGLEELKRDVEAPS